MACSSHAGASGTVLTSASTSSPGAGPWQVIVGGTSAPGEFFEPSGVAVDRDGNVYVADRRNYRIQKLSPTGDVLAQWGIYGSGLGQFHSLSGVAVDQAGTVYVTQDGAGFLFTEDYDHGIQVFSASGAALAKWGTCV